MWGRQILRLFPSHSRSVGLTYSFKVRQASKLKLFKVTPLLFPFLALRIHGEAELRRGGGRQPAYFPFKQISPPNYFKILEKKTLSFFFESAFHSFSQNSYEKRLLASSFPFICPSIRNSGTATRRNVTKIYTESPHGNSLQASIWVKIGQKQYVHYKKMTFPSFLSRTLTRKVL